MDKIVKIDSTVPAAAIKWPVAPLVEDTASFLAWFWNNLLIAMVSTLSPEVNAVSCSQLS